MPAGSSSDPEPYAWVLTRLGWLHALRGEPAPRSISRSELSRLPARSIRARTDRLAARRRGRRGRLPSVGATVEATRALAEIDPAVSVDAVGAQDPRGYAIWLAERDAARAVALLDEELKSATGCRDAHGARVRGVPERRRRSPPRHAMRWRPVARASRASPRRDRPRRPCARRRALATGPGLLPSERTLAEVALRSQSGLVAPH